MSTRPFTKTHDAFAILESELRDLVTLTFDLLTFESCTIGSDGSVMPCSITTVEKDVKPSHERDLEFTSLGGKQIIGVRTRHNTGSSFVMVALWNRADHYIFILSSVLSFFFLLFFLA